MLQAWCLSMFDLRRGLEPSSQRNTAEALTAVLNPSNTFGPERGAERMFMYLNKGCWLCAPSCEMEPDLLQQMTHHQIDLFADRNLVSRRDLLSARTRLALRPWRVFTEANTRAVPRSGERGFYCGIGAEPQHGGCSFSSRVLSALAQIQRRCQVNQKRWWNRLLQCKRSDSRTCPSSVV